MARFGFADSRTGRLKLWKSSENTPALDRVGVDQGLFRRKQGRAEMGGGGGLQIFGGPILGLAYIMGYDPPGGSAHRGLDESRFV